MRIDDLSAHPRSAAYTATAPYLTMLPATNICSCAQCQQHQQFAIQLRLIVLALLGSLLCLALMPKSIDAVALPISAQQGVFDCAAVTEIPQTECEALVALYNSTNGPGWADSTGWLATTTPCSWVGVGCAAGHVQRLTLISQQMIGSLPTSMGNLSNLEILELYQNQLSGPIPAEIGNLLNLRELALSGNQLNGPIPLALANLTSLEQMTLSGNQLTGTVPVEFGALTNLKSLALGGNQLHGTIPAELGNLTALTSLRLQNNQLSGAIPSWLGNLTNLQYLFLNGNQLSGTLPAALGNLTNLQWLHLYANQLNGSLPLNLVQLTNITNFDFQNTNLCEPTATTFQTWLAGIANVQRTNIPCPNPDQLLSVHLLAFDNHAGNIDTNLTPSYPAVVAGALAATQDVLTKTVALLVDLDGVGDTHVVIIRNGTVVHLLGEDDLNLHLAQKFAGWQLPIAPETTVEAQLPATDGTLTTSTVFEYDMADGVQLGGFLQWLFNTYIEDAAATQTLLSYVGHGAAVVPADDVAATIGVTTCDDVEYGQPAGNTGIIALPGGSLGAHPAFTDCHGQPNSTGDYRPTLLAPRSLADAISTALANSPVEQIDLLDLFHCFALSLEALAEFAGDPANGIAPLADTIIGSPHYTFFAPQMVGAVIAGDNVHQSPATRAAAILDMYDQQIQSSGNSTAYPRLLVAVAGANLQPLLVAWEGVATRLYTLLATQATQSDTRQKLQESYTDSAKYDTTYCAPQDWELTVPDALSDLGDFTRRLLDQSADAALTNAAKLLLETLQATIQQQIAVDGVPSGLNPAAQTPWTFANHMGLSLYTDFGRMEIPGYGANRSWQAYWYHNGTNGNPAPYTFTAHSQWDEVLQQFWQLDDPNGEVNAVFCLPELVLLPTHGEGNKTDLAVRAITAPTGATLTPGVPVHFTAQITTAETTTRYIDVRFQVAMNGTPVFTETIVLTRLLAAGDVASVTTNALWLPEDTGTAVLTVIVDPRDHVAETDEDNNRQNQTYTIGTLINLYQGWNLIALPVLPVDPAPTAVFAPIAGMYDQVYTYDRCDTTDPWKAYDPNAPLPQLNDLTEITPAQGIWIHVTQDATFVPAGAALGTGPIPLCPGWNMVGYPSVDPVPLPQALATIAGQYTQVQAYHAADLTDPWKAYDPNAPLPQLNDLAEMEAGRGYWIEVTEQTILTIN